MKKITYLLCGLFLLVGNSLSLAAESLQTRLSSTQVYEGEAFELMISSKAALPNVNPDISALEKDFQVIGRHKQTQYQNINGKSSSETQWIFRLMAKKSGQLTVPVVRIGDHASETLQIKVLATDDKKDDGQMPAAFIDVSIDNTKPYVLSQVIYTVKLYYARQMTQGELSAPQMSAALVLPIGDESHYQEERDGQIYQVVERQYAIFPQSSGELEIEAPVFRGLMVASNVASMAQRSLMFQPLLGLPTQPIQLNGRTQSVQVQPIPAVAGDGHWLPAKQVQLRETWDHDLSQLQMGEPITREIRIKATSAMAAQLPELNVASPEEVNQYIDPQQSINYVENKQIIAERVQKIVYIPNQAGEFTLEGITLTWWDTEAQQLRSTTLPAKKIKVLAATTAAPATAATPPSGELVAYANEPEPRTTLSMPWILAVIFFILWLLTLGVWWLRQQDNKATHKFAHFGKFFKFFTFSKKQAMTAKQLRAAIERACLNNNPEQASENLLRWAQKHWPQHSIRHLQDMIPYLEDDDLRRALEQLVTLRYDSRSQADWSGEHLWQLFSQWLKRRQPKNKTQNEASDLPDLYPK